MGLTATLLPRQSDPENLESPQAIFDSFLTPASLFYVRSHFDIPDIDVAKWRLRIDGAVIRSVELDYRRLRALPARTVTATLECAGNSRSFLPQKTKGVQWGLGAVGTAEWTGVPLSSVLEVVGLAEDATEIVFEGSDRGTIDGPPSTPGEIPYARSLPLRKALEGSVLLAYLMNGEPLPVRHGFPLRVIVPGWYGMASVKWLSRVIAARQPFAGYFQTFEYSRWERHDGNPTLSPLTRGAVKAEISEPAPGTCIAAGSICRIRGAAWAGESEVEKVEVSVDDGDSWQRAELLDTPRRYCWTRWQWDWRAPAESRDVALLARATDKEGRTQPWHHNPDERHYAIHHVLPVTVRVHQSCV